MRKLPIILTLLLVAAWAYTCWYWYTCNIKGFCDSDANYSVNQITTVTSNNENNYIAQTQSIETEIKIDEKIATDDIKKAPKLSAEDVLFDPLPKEIEAENTIEEEVIVSETSQSGALIDEKLEASEERETETTDTKIANICDTPLVGPIVFGGENIKKEVEILETFLISIGEDLTIDRIYKSDDVEAVKRFQLKYKQDVLDPWGITTPTGYVGKTSIAKINEIACK